MSKISAKDIQKLREMTGTGVMSCKEALDKVKEARDERLPIFAETCPQYMLRSYQNYLEPGF